MFVSFEQIMQDKMHEFLTDRKVGQNNTQIPTKHI